MSAERTIGLGHNRPPDLAEELAGETEGLAARAHDLIIDADERSEIVDDETAAKAVLLLGMMKEHIELVEAARVKRKEPFLENGRVVDRHFHTIMLPLAGPDPEKRVEGSTGDLLARIDAWRLKKEVEAAAERQRLEAAAEEQRRAAEASRQAQWAAEEKARQEKEEAERKLEEAQRAAAAARTPEEQANAKAKQVEAERERIAADEKAKHDVIDAGIAVRRAEDEAAKIAAQAKATVARPIDSGFGPKASGRSEWTAEITHLNQAIAYCIASGYEAPFRELVQTIYNRLVRGKNGARVLPGANVIEGSSTTLRRK